MDKQVKKNSVYTIHTVIFQLIYANHVVNCIAESKLIIEYTVRNFYAS